MNKTIQAKQIGDDVIVQLVRDWNINRNEGAARDKFIEYFRPIYPAKVVNAKLRQCVLKGLISGCKDSSCDTCCGDYRLTAIGQALLSGKGL